MSNETLIGTLIVLFVLVTAAALPLIGRALRNARAEARELATPFLHAAARRTGVHHLEPPVEAPSKDPARVEFDAAVERMLLRYHAESIDRSRLAGEIEHHWAHHVAGTCTWSVAFASLEAWVRRHARPVNPRVVQSLRDPRPHVSARHLAPTALHGHWGSVLIDETGFNVPPPLGASVIGQDHYDRVDVEGVRDLIQGRITNPLPGTLAAEVREWAQNRALQLVDDINELTNTNPKAA